MKKMIIIPARYNSSRFPGKPLIDIFGKSMIERVYDVCVSALNPQSVIIATDDERIRQHCVLRKLKVVMTSPDCLTGTDRVFEASKQFNADVYINVQGDEPLIVKEDIEKVIAASDSNPNTIINAMANINSADDFYNVNIPKVVARPDGSLLYMSRAPIPANKGQEFIRGSRQVCIYAFPKKVLDDYCQQERKTALEEVEDIEILRFLELGHNVQMVSVTGNSVAVDTLEDYQKVLAIFSEKQGGG